MAGSVGDVVQLTLSMSIDVVQMRNIYFYMVEDAPTATYLTGLCTEFQETCLPSYAAIQTASYKFDSLHALNLFSGDEFVDSALSPAQGTRAQSGDLTATFVSAMIRLTRQNNRVRHGRKAIYLPMEADLAWQQITSGTVTLLNTHAATLDDNLDAGGIDLFKPVIVGRVPVGSPPDVTYRLPQSQAELGDNWSAIGAPAVINRVSTQNSRKFWRGI